LVVTIGDGTYVANGIESDGQKLSVTFHDPGTRVD
jgi:hypothetical protein